MTGRFLKAASVYSLISIGEKGLALLTFPLIAAKLNPNEYGLYELTNFLVLLCMMVGSLEFAQSLLRYIPEAETEAEKSTLLSTALISTALFSGVVCVGVGFFIPLLGSMIFGAPGHENLLRWSIALIFLYANANVLQAAARAQIQLAVLLKAAGTRLVVQTVLVLILVFLFKWQAEAILAAQIAGFALLAGVLGRSNFRLIRWQWCRKTFIRLFVFSGPLLLGSIIAVFSQQSDRIIVRLLLGVENVGVLGTAYRLASFVSLVTSGVVMALSPLIFQLYREPGTPTKINRILRYYTCGIIVMASVMTVGAGPLLGILTPKSYHDAAGLIPILGFTLMLSQLPSFFPGLAIAGKSHVLAMSQGAGLIVNVAGMVLMGRPFGLIGVCLSGILGQLTTLALVIYFGHKHYPIQIPWTPLCLCLSLFLSGYGYWNFGSGKTIASAIILVLVSCGSAAAVALKHHSGSFRGARGTVSEQPREQQ